MDSTNTPAKDASQKEFTPKMSDELLEFVKKLEEFKTAEEKIAFGLSYMRDTVSQEGSPRFKEFWESRRLVLPIFKENINSVARSKFWDEYIELTQEARRLKEVLQEQSSFALEQIDLAVGAIEKELTELDGLLMSADSIKFSQIPSSLRKRMDSYTQIQKELNLLNAFASRLNALRKEVIKTDMRVRFKTKFFKRLSQLGDLIFPRRKKQIEEMSAQFKKDVEFFISKHFKGDEVVGAPYYALREEIKAFQSLAKDLTLNSAVFGSTRLSLSKCWDTIKALDEEHKKELQIKKEASLDDLKAIQEKVEVLKAKAQELSLKDLDTEIEALSAEMRAIYIDRDDARNLKHAFAEMRKPHLEAQEQKRKELEEAAKEKLRLKKEKMLAVQEKISVLINASEMTLEELEKEYAELEAEISLIELSSAEGKQIDRQLVPLKDLLADKRDVSLLNLSDDDLKALENYKTVLEQKVERRALIKEQVDVCRKALGSSSLDFEKSLQLSEQLDAEKERLDKANDAIEELEQKISDLES